MQDNPLIKKNENGKQVPTLIVNKDIEIVKRIFYEYCEDNTSLGILAKELTEEGILGIGRKSWDNVALSRILRNPVYTEADADVYKYYKEKGMSL